MLSGNEVLVAAFHEHDNLEMIWCFDPGQKKD